MHSGRSCLGAGPTVTSHIKTTWVCARMPALPYHGMARTISCTSLQSPMMFLQVLEYWGTLAEVSRALLPHAILSALPDKESLAECVNQASTEVRPITVPAYYRSKNPSVPYLDSV